MHRAFTGRPLFEPRRRAGATVSVEKHLLTMREGGKMNKMNKLRFCLVYFSLLVLVLGAAAQVQNGQFTGTVTDPSGAAIANAKVTVTNIGTNLSVTTTSSESGLYTAKELPVGSYRITSEVKGFKTASNTNVTLNAGTTARVDFKMELGQAREV